MKKILALLTILVGTFSFSGNKEDFEKAIKDFNKTQNVENLAKDLKKISLKASDEYVVESKLQLSEINIAKKDLKEAKRYLSEIIIDKKATKEQKIQAYTRLFNLEEKNDLRVKYLEGLVSLDSKNLEFQAKQIAFHDYLKNTKKVDELYKMYIKNLKQEEKDIFDFLLANSYQNEEASKKIYERLINSSNDEIKVISYIQLSNYEISKNNIEKSKDYLEKVSKIAKEKEHIAYINSGLAEIYLNKKEFDKAKEKIEKALSVEKNEKIYALAIFIGEYSKDTKFLKVNLDNFKKYLKENSLLLNAIISEISLDFDLELSEKYAKIAVEKDKIPTANVLLSIIYGRKGNKKEALKYLNEAKKAKINIPNGLEEEINKLK